MTCLGLQALAPRIKLPASYSRPYRDAVKFIKRYTIDEELDLLWIGCLIAKLGPPGFRKLWAKLQPAGVHYFYGFDATLADIDAAAANMLDYAKLLEQHADKGEVCAVSLSYRPPAVRVSCCFAPPCTLLLSLLLGEMRAISLVRLGNFHV